jgi:hypothetical protein
MILGSLMMKRLGKYLTTDLIIKIVPTLLKLIKTLKMAVAHSFRMPVNIYKTTWHHIPEDSILNKKQFILHIVCERECGFRVTSGSISIWTFYRSQYKINYKQMCIRMQVGVTCGKKYNKTWINTALQSLITTGCIWGSKKK